MRWTCLTDRDNHGGWRDSYTETSPKWEPPKPSCPLKNSPFRTFFFFAYLTFSSHSYISPQALSGLHNLSAPIPGLQHTESALTLPGASILFSSSLSFPFYLFIYAFIYLLGVWARACPCARVEVRGRLVRSQSSFSAMWVSAVQFRLVRSAANTFTYPPSHLFLIPCPPLCTCVYVKVHLYMRVHMWRLDGSVWYCSSGAFHRRF